jgi:CDGSH-type Zn-finger protein
MSAVKITVNTNGSLKIEGPIELVDAAGNALPTREGKPVFLCRCGASANKPFCDGAHKSVDFDGSPC